MLLMILLHLNQLDIGDIVSIPHIGLARLGNIKPDVVQDNLCHCLRYYFFALNEDKVVVSIPDSGCYGPYPFFSPFQTLDAYW